MSGDPHTDPVFSVIVPAGRGSSAEPTIRALLALPGPSREVIVAGPQEVAFEGVRFIHLEDPNPAVRRNAAARVAGGAVLAFIDDDAVPAEDWLLQAEAIFAHPDVIAAGGVDPGPLKAPLTEQISDTLLAAPWIGSGVAAHERRRKSFVVRRAHDVALVNLFVRREQFLAVGGLSQEIGYIGEDSALVEQLIRSGTVMFHPQLVVHHRRRAFPFQFLRQRFRYRVKLGRMLAGGSRRWTPAIVALLLAPLLLALAFVLSPAAGAVLLALYAVLTVVAGGAASNLPFLIWPLFPLFFLLHHGTYWLGLVTGLVTGMGSRTAPAQVRENGP